MTTAVELFALLPPHILPMFCVRTFKVYSLSSCKVHHTVLLPALTGLCIRSPQLTYLMTRGLYPLTNSFHFPHLPAPGIHHSTLCFYEFDFLSFCI